MISACILAKQKPRKDGYVVTKVLGMLDYAHRRSYIKSKGDIPKGLTIDHLCKVRNCINPEHLECVTLQENIRRSSNNRVKKLVCKHGHLMEGSNLVIRSTGKRCCRTCKNNYNRKYHNKLEGEL